MSDARQIQIARAVVLLALFATPALIYMHGATASDADIWWHLRTGEWIEQHRAVPFTDPFSGPGMGKPWSAYSWMFELIVFGLFEKLRLVGIVAYAAGMIAAITAAVYHLLRRVQPDFTVVVLMTLVVSYSLGRLYAPRPWLFSILFFTLQLDILLYARKTGRKWELLWLPLLYAFWANLHIQFIDGLVVLGLAVVESAVQAVRARWDGEGSTRGTTGLPLLWTVGFAGACLAGTLVNPYGWGIYKVAYDLATQQGVVNNIAELQAIPFRAMPDYLMLFLTLLGAGSLGWGRKLPIFETGLLVFGALVSFRTGRDMWVMAIVASAMLVARIEVKSREPEPKPLRWWAIPAMAVALGAILWIGFRAMHLDNPELSAQLAKDMPVEAVKSVMAHQYGGQIYNNYDWGGYLIWALREPVSIDGRASLSGDTRIEREFATWGGQPGWNSDPDLQAATVVIGPVKAPLSQLLRMDGRFELAYEDKLAMVFVKRGSSRQQ